MAGGAVPVVFRLRQDDPGSPSQTGLIGDRDRRVALEQNAINCTPAQPEGTAPFYPNDDEASAINCTWSCASTSHLQLHQAALAELLTHSTSEATKRAYSADLGHYLASGGTIPSGAEVLALYIADISRTHRPATLARRLAAIGKAHRLKGFADPTKDEIIKSLMRGVRRVEGTAQAEAKPLLREDLAEALEAMGDRPKDVRDAALLLLGFAGAFRRSELVGLNIGDIEPVRQGLVVHIRRSKTDQEGRGRKIGIPFARGRHCPVKALERWLQLVDPDQPHLFPLIDRHGRVHPKRLSGEAVSLIVKDRLAKSGRDPIGFSGHSLRAGFATSAAIAGASTYKIRQQTGHASDAMLNRYIRDGDMFTNNAAGAVL
jgi:integrase